MVLTTMAALSGRDEPVSTEELARLALILKRIEGTDKLRLDRERAAKKAAQGAGQAKRQGGALAGGRRHHPCGGGGQAPAASPHRHVGAGGPVEPS